jgi:glycosyltransferase involved in cell wall biosynthesis
VQTSRILAKGRATLGARLGTASDAAGETAVYFRAADAFVLATLHESFGRVIVEALAHGLPVILHRGPAFREIAGPHARYVAMHDQGALAAALARPESWRESPQGGAEAAHRWVYERYGWDGVRPR